MAFLDAGDFAQLRHEFGTWLGRANAYEGQHREAERGGIDVDGPTADDAFTLEPPKTIVNRRRSESDALRKIFETLGGILEERFEEAEIFSIETGGMSLIEHHTE